MDELASLIVLAICSQHHTKTPITSGRYLIVIIFFPRGLSGLGYTCYMFTVKVPEETVVKLTDMIGETTDTIQTMAVRANRRVEEATDEIKAAGLVTTSLVTAGLIAFGLISLVAVSALLIASTKK